MAAASLKTVLGAQRNARRKQVADTYLAANKYTESTLNSTSSELMMVKSPVVHVGSTVQLSEAVVDMFGRNAVET